MADYVKFSMPRSQADRLLMLAELGAKVQENANGFQFADAAILQRIRLAVGGRDMRAENRFPKPKGKRMAFLDLRRKRA